MKNNTRIETKGDVAIVTPLADFTVFFCLEAADEMDLLVDRGVTRFIFQMAQVTWIDSLGLGCLVKAALRGSVKPVLVLADERVKLSLMQAGLADHFQHAASLERARDLIGGSF